MALMAIGLDAIGIDMHHQSTDLAAGTGGDRHGRNGVGHRPSAPRLSGCKDCGAARPDPCCRLGGGQCGGGPWRCFGDPRGAPSEVRSCEHGPGGWGMGIGPSGPWFEGRPWGCASGERGVRELSKPCGRGGHLGWCIVPRASAMPVARLMLLPPHQCSAPAPPGSTLGKGCARRRLGRWRDRSCGLTTHGLVFWALGGGVLLVMSRPSAVGRLHSWFAWLRFGCRRIRLR